MGVSERNEGQCEIGGTTDLGGELEGSQGVLVLVN